VKGHYAALLHYIYRISENIFRTNPLSYTIVQREIPVFNESSYQRYLVDLENALADDLRVMRKAAQRDRPRRRMPLQAELTLLRNYKFVSADKYRLGVGIPIDWERVQTALTEEL
jgi:hypothetical protein